MVITKKFILAKFHLTLKEKDEIKMNNSVKDIIQDIINIITDSTGNTSSVNWKNWYIGLTVYPNQEKREHGKPAKWKYWKANSSADALKIQNYFLDKFPINLSRKNGKYDYFVYVFKK
ncbi:MAG: hypothetical protein L3J35_03435 [Bacteroidales bacterium]|nr:hypothetical protein [Bacteroidales bacterium]